MKMFGKTTGTGQDVVIFHGLCSTHTDMQPIVDQLSDRYRVTAMDSPGIGLSDWNDHIHSIEETVDALLPFLPPKAIYIGWSLGGSIAQCLAAKHPERVSKIIGIGTTPKFVETKDWPGMPALSPVCIPMLHEQGAKAFAWGFYENEFADLHPTPASFEVLKAQFATRPPVSDDVVLRYLDICDALDLRKAFSTITCPIHLIMGSLDVATPAAAFPHIKKLSPHAYIHEMPGVKHMPFWTHQKEFKALLEKILAAE